MKRKHQQYRTPVIRLKKSDCYPMIFCTHENKAIALCSIRHKHESVQVDAFHWQPSISKFLKGYRINFDGIKSGDKVYCPKCSHPVDFRMWTSNTVPQLQGDVE